MNDAPVVDAEVVEPGAELAVATPASTTLFHTDDPAEVLERATKTANALKGVLKKQNLTTSIHGKDHVNVEGWQTLGAMLGVTPVCVWSRPVDGGWEARVEARTLDGRVIGAAEAQCLKEEGGPWGGADYARRSMAQTRATSKALGSVLRFVVTLAGYNGTPAEEMPRDAGASTASRDKSGGQSPAATRSGGDASAEASTKQKRFLTNLLNDAGVSREAQKAIVQFRSGGERVTKQAASKLISDLKDNGATLESLLAEMEGAAQEGDEAAKEATAAVPSDVPIDMTDFDENPRPVTESDLEDVPF